MQLNKYFILLLIAVFLILGFWGVMTFTPKSDNEDPATPVASELVAVEEIRISPAHILSVIQLGDVFTVKGTGVPNANLSLLQQGENEALATTIVSAEGEWEQYFDMPLATNEFILNLLMVTANGQEVRSDQSLVFIKYRSFDENSVGKLTDDVSNVPDKSLILLSAPGSNSRVLQTPFASLPGQKGFVLEAVDYDHSGGVIFSGLSVQLGKVRVYANGNFVGESSVNNAGRWNLIFGNVMPRGRYNIAAELVYSIKSETDESEVEETIFLNLPFSSMQPLLETENNPNLVVEYLEDRIQIGRALYGGGYQFTAVYSPQALILPVTE